MRDSPIYRLIDLLFELYILAFIIRAVISWFRVDTRHPLVEFLRRITDPMLNPIRARLSLAGGVDFSPLVAVLILVVIRAIVFRILYIL